MILQNSNAIEDNGYTIDRSLRFNNASAQYATRTFVAGNTTKWTFSFWLKRGSLGGYGILGVQANIAAHPLNRIALNTDGTLSFTETNSGGTALYTLNTTRVFRDVGAFYHIMFVYDSGNTTSTDRLILYVNGIRETAFNTQTYPTLNLASTINGASAHQLGRMAANSTAECFDGYLSEVIFIDGQALSPASFGEIRSDTGQWIPKKYSGTYGTTGFYLNFIDGTSTATLLQDKSGNTNNWTPTNFTRAVGINDCWMQDTPTNNFATLNNLWAKTTNGVTINANLSNTGGANPTKAFPATIAATSGKFYAEFVPNSISFCQFGVVDIDLFPFVSGGVNGAGGITWDVSSTGTYYNNGGSSAAPVTVIANDIIMCAVDVDARKVWFGKNGVWNSGGNPTVGTGEVGSLSGTGALTFFCRAESTTAHANFGQRAFTYTPPIGFKSLSKANLPIPTISRPTNHFYTSSYTGDGLLTRKFTDTPFSPDLVWIKARTGTFSNSLWNSVVGVGINTALSSDRNVNETTHATDAVNGYISSIDSNGFSVVRGSTGAYTNSNAVPYVAWQWRASDSESTPNSDGNVISQVSANKLAGFSVVTYTGTGTTANVGHGLGVKPSLIIVKRRDSTGNWIVAHKSLTDDFYYMFMNTTAAQSNTNGNLYWNGSGTGTPNFFRVGSNADVNASGGSYVAYCFTDVAGYSKFGSYLGNGSADGQFIYCGFKPAYIMIKCASATGEWIIKDYQRNPFNEVNNNISASSPLAENEATTVGSTAVNEIDFTSIGFKLRDTHNYTNTNGSTYIYMAFADAPFNYTNAR